VPLRNGPSNVSDSMGRAKVAAYPKAHQVSFDESKAVFFGDVAVRSFDEERSEDEERC
jgi:uncharacterized DUF497 family protein